MRIAFSGAHRVGKTTLLERVAEELPEYVVVPEPYYLLEEEGYHGSENPSIEDFEAQLERSISSLEEAPRKVLFDRCPADLLAYLLTHRRTAEFLLHDWLERIHSAMRSLDLIVFVPIEDPERIALTTHEDARHRLAVHEKLEDLLVNDDLGFGTDVLAVPGDVPERLAQVMARVAIRGE